MSLNTILIGLGAVGLNYDLKNNDITTHIKSLKKIKKYNLSYAVDIDKKKQKIVSKKYNLKFTTDLKELKNKINIETFVVLSSPTDTHLSIFKKISNYGFKKIMIEKPIGKNLTDNKKIIEICKKKKIQLFTNYFRRSLTLFAKIKAILKQEIIGEIVGGELVYDKYLLNNGCHAIDVLNFLFDDDCKLTLDKVLKKKKEKKSWICNFILRYKQKLFLFKCNENLKKRNLYIRIYGKKGYLQFNQADSSSLKIISYDKKRKKIYKNHREFNKRQYVVFQKLYKNINDKYQFNYKYFEILTFPHKIMKDIIRG